MSSQMVLSFEDKWYVHPCDKTPNSQDADGKFVSPEDSKGPHLSRLAMVRRGSSLDGCLWGVSLCILQPPLQERRRNSGLLLLVHFYLVCIFNKIQTLFFFPQVAEKSPTLPVTWGPGPLLPTCVLAIAMHCRMATLPPLHSLSTSKTNMTKSKCDPVALTVILLSACT